MHGRVQSKKAVWRDYREALSLALPAMGDMALISVSGALDTLMVGRALGAEALAAVGLTIQPRLLMLCPFFALNTAVTAAVARRKGQRDGAGACAALRGGLLLALWMSLALAVLAWTLAGPILRQAGAGRAASETLLRDAGMYFRITACALPANALGMCVCAALRGAGRSRAALWINGIASLVHGAGDLGLIEGRWGLPRLGVAGAAAASAIGMGAAMTLALGTVMIGRRDAELRLSIRGGKKGALRELWPVMGSAVLEQFSLRLGYFLSTRFLFSLGATLYAAHQICAQWQNLTFSLGDGLGAAALALVGRRMGRGEEEAALRMGKVCLRCALAVSLAAGVGILLFRGQMASWFLRPGTANGQAAIEAAAQALLALAGCQLFQICAGALAGALRGAGDNRFVTKASAACVSGLRPLLTALAVRFLGDSLLGVWALTSLETASRCLLLGGRLRRRGWPHRKM